MPGRDGTGPMGRGAATGRGLGFCTGAYAGRHAVGAGLGFGCGCNRPSGSGYRGAADGENVGGSASKPPPRAVTALGTQIGNAKGVTEGKF